MRKRDLIFHCKCPHFTSGLIAVISSISFLNLEVAPSMQSMTQNERFKLCRPVQVIPWLEKANLEHCTIFNVNNTCSFLRSNLDVLSVEVDNKFIGDAYNAKKALPALAEFVVWHLFIHALQEFDGKFAKSGQCNQWFSSGSPNFIDIIALRKVNNIWRFYAIEVKWSENCNYNNQVRSGLVKDLIKLHRFEYANSRLGAHITALKTQLKYVLDREEIEDIFSGIYVGDTPGETQGVEYWGVFVSDWATDPNSHDPNNHFQKLTEQAHKDSWPTDSVKGLMLNIENGNLLLHNLAMGRI